MKTKGISILIGLVGALFGLSIIFLRHIAFGSYEFGIILGLALTVAVLPYGIIVYLEDRENYILEKDLLDYLSQIESYVKSGKSLVFVLTVPKNERKKPLKKRLLQLEKMLNLGMTPDEALNKITESMPTLISKEAFSIIHRLVVYGGDVSGVLESAREHLGDLFAIENEKRSVMRNYGSIIYISFFILLVIIIFFIRFFVYKFSSASFATPFSSATNTTLLKNLMLQFLIVEGFVSGLITGKLIAGKTSSGFVHSAIMILLTLVTYSIFL
ncbi:MAG: type II secretion system F family protein [Nitrososphaeria archaeon]